MIDPLTQTCFHSDYNLEAWYPEGVLDGPKAIAMANFISYAELISELPFDRFLDLSRLDVIDISLIEIADVAATRRAMYDGGLPVKSAILASSQPAHAVARMFAELMKPSSIKVQAFRTIGDAAEWLNVPVDVLLAES